MKHLKAVLAAVLVLGVAEVGTALHIPAQALDGAGRDDSFW